MKTFNDICDVTDRVSFPGYALVVSHERANYADPYLQVSCSEGTCNVTGKPMFWRGRKWRLSYHMTDGEIVQTAFMAVMAANEHETREKFTYRGVTVFDPHYDIEKLVELRKRPDALKERDPS